MTVLLNFCFGFSDFIKLFAYNEICSYEKNHIENSVKKNTDLFTLKWKRDFENQIEAVNTYY